MLASDTKLTKGTVHLTRLDLNNAPRKSVSVSDDQQGKSDAQLADEFWKAHKDRNESFIIDTFQGLYRSKTTCLSCGWVRKCIKLLYFSSYNYFNTVHNAC